MVLSWAIAAFGCSINGFAYMELSSLVPSAGSVYAYSYYALGEVFAVIAAWCLTLEYGVSGAAVARSWGTKVVYWLQSMSHNSKALAWLDNEHCSVAAAVMQLLCMLLLLCGLSLGRRLVNTVTVIKIGLILFMTIAALCAFDADNLEPFVPPQFGTSGILQGSTAAFFGFIGFDEVCCMAGEAKNPTKVMPRAVVGTIVGTAGLSIMASLGLVGMLHYELIDSDAGFASGFEAHKWVVAAHITQAGEVLTLPIVVFIAFLAQPRLTFAMAKDGLAPPMLGWLDTNGNIFWGTLLSGVLLTLVALAVPFEHLDDMVSAGVIISFCLANCCLFSVRYSEHSPRLALTLLCCFVVSSCISVFLWVHIASASAPLTGVATVLSMGMVVGLWLLCPQNSPLSTASTFRAPFVPVLPALAMYLNWLLLAQLSTVGLLLISGWLVLAVVTYLMYGLHHSMSGLFVDMGDSIPSAPSVMHASFCGEHQLLDTDLYRAPVRVSAETGKGQWIYSQRSRTRADSMVIKHKGGGRQAYGG